jgi:hypothetical protein
VPLPRISVEAFAFVTRGVRFIGLGAVLDKERFSPVVYLVTFHIWNALK